MRELVTAVMLGLLISESSELSPWLAQKLIRWATQVRYPTRVEELSALIAERPGKLLKLVTATGFACAALTYRVTHRKTAPVHSLTSRFWIGLGSALVAGVLLTGELLLARVITSYISDHTYHDLLIDLIFLGATATFATAAELLVSIRLPAGWATAVMTFALYLIASVVWGFVPRGGELLYSGGMAGMAGVSAACAIRLGNRLRFPVMAASSTILGVALLALTVIWTTPTSTPQYVNNLVWMSRFGFALGFSVEVGILLWHVLCGRQPSQSSSERVTHRDATLTIAARAVARPREVGSAPTPAGSLPGGPENCRSPGTISDAMRVDGQTS